MKKIVVAIILTVTTVSAFASCPPYAPYRCVPTIGGKRVGDKNGVLDGVHTCTPPEDVRSA